MGNSVAMTSIVTRERQSRMARFILYGLWLVACAVSAVAADEFRFQEKVAIPMRDGVELAANLWLPPDDTPVPVILLRTPYGRPREGWGRAEEFVRAGFAVVAQDCRGRGDSQGTWYPFRDDPADGVDTQKWIGEQSWCNQRIGTSGGSYVGWTQWASAPDATPMLKAMVPIVPFHDAYHDVAYAGGAYHLSLLTTWGAVVGGAQLDPEKTLSALRHLPLRTLGDQFNPPVPFITRWIEHDQYDTFWRQRGIDRHYEKVSVPTLNIGGWYDIFSKATVEMVDRVRNRATNRMVRRNQFVIMGPWAHGVGRQTVGELDFGPDAALDLKKLELDWFRYWLNDEETGIDEWPPYQIFVMGENRWRGESEWPIARTVPTKFFFHSDGDAHDPAGSGQLLRLPPSGEQPSDVYRYDGDNPVPTMGGNNLAGAPTGPRDQSSVEQRDDVLVYTSPLLDHPIEVTGQVTAILYAATTATDTDFTAKLVDVHPDGKVYNLCDGVIRARFRQGLDSPKLVEPGKIERYEVDLWVTSNLFLPGHRIGVEISSSNFPRFDRNPNSGKPFGTDTDLLEATQTIYHDADHRSHIVLPVIPR